MTASMAGSLIGVSPGGQLQLKQPRGHSIHEEHLDPGEALL
jgi:hypothetical protein